MAVKIIELSNDIIKAFAMLNYQQILKDLIEVYEQVSILSLQTWSALLNLQSQKIWY